MYRARDGWVALNLARQDDRELLPALLLTDGDIVSAIARWPCKALVARGREMGMAIAHAGEQASGPAVATAQSQGRSPPAHRRPLVVDLSALWAGPLASHLLHLAGAEVVKVESLRRPDAMRGGDPAFFALLNQGKASVALDLSVMTDVASLRDLVMRADIVIEAARPRALRQIGIDADAVVARTPGLVWLSITGHGIDGANADHVAFGDDAGIAGGLGAAMEHAAGTVGFVGDAIADPMTGIAAARIAWTGWTTGAGGRVVLAMSAVVRKALREEAQRSGPALDAALRVWRDAAGSPFPPVPARPAAKARPFGADTGRWIRVPC